MTRDIALALAVTGGDLALFIWNRLRIELVGLLALVTLVLLGLLEPDVAVQGFANEATVTVGLMLGLSAGLVRTGAVDALGRWIERIAGTQELRLTVVLLVLVVPISALINNTAAVAILLPIVLRLARRSNVAPSRLLMPLSFGSQMGGTLTLIGTSTNLLVAGLVLELGVGRIELFDITPAALVLTAVGVLYLLTVGRWLIPRRPAAETPLTSRELRDYLTELTVSDDSALIGKGVAEAKIEKQGEEEKPELLLVGLRRGSTRIFARGKRFAFKAGDRLLLRGAPHAIAELAEASGLKVEATASELAAEEREVGELKLAELLVPPASHAIGRRLSGLRWRLPDGVTVLAMQRHGQALVKSIDQTALSAGDLLLVRAPLADLKQLHSAGDFAVLGEVQGSQRRESKRWLATGILAATVLLAALTPLTILVAALLGIVAMLLTGCVETEELYEDIDWGVLILLATLLSLGTALQETGAAEFLAGGFVEVLKPYGPYAVLGALYLLTSLLTEVLTNNAAAVVLTPVAVATAVGLGLSPMPFVVAVMFAASNSFATPIGYQTNTFIYGPGGYKFTDFLRVGLPLVLLLAAVGTWAIPLFFPF